MTTFLTFVIFPLAIIFAAIILETTIRRPVIVALAVFTIFFVLTFTIFVPTFVVAAIIYSMITYIVALITELALRNLPKFLRLNFGEGPYITRLNRSSNLTEVDSDKVTDFPIYNNVTNNIANNEIDDVDRDIDVGHKLNGRRFENKRVDNEVDDMDNRVISNRASNRRHRNNRLNSEDAYANGAGNDNLSNILGDTDASDNSECNCRYCRARRQLNV